MRKLYFVLLFTLFSFFLAPQKVVISADSVSTDEFKTHTVYTENIIDYVDLENINKISVNEENIAYTLDNETLVIFNKSDKSYKAINNFNNIKKIAFVNSYILVADNNNIKVIKDLNETNANDLEILVDISWTNLKAIDIYTNNKYTFIGLIDNQKFELYKFSNSLTNLTNARIKTIDSVQFISAYMLTINENNAYIVTNNIQPKIHTLNLTIENATLSTKDFKTYAQLIDTFIYNQTEYIISFTQENLYLFDSNINEISNININNTSNKLPIQQLSDITYFNDTIYTCDKTYRTIQTFKIINSDNKITLDIDQIILGSYSKAIGRFNNIYDFFIQGKEIIVSDTNNNRIQIINNATPTIIEIEKDTSPKSIILDNNHNLFYVKDILDTSSLVKYTFDNFNYSKSSEISLSHNNKIGYISDITITNNNIIYLLDYSNNRLLYYTAPNIEIKKSFASDGFILDSSSKIEYLKKLDKLVLFNKNNLYLLDLDGKILSSLNIPNSKDITVGLDSVIVLFDNDKISHFTFIDNSFNYNNLDIEYANFSNYNLISYDITSNKIYAFNNERQCFEYFDYTYETQPTFNEINIAINETLTDNDTLIPITITSSTKIYQYPYHLGNVYNLDKSITKCLGIQEYAEYYRVLFAYNDTLTSGYIEKKYAKIENIINKPIEVLTTNQKVPVYKYPTILQYNNSTISTKELPINTVIKLTSQYPISIDNKVFYIYKEGNNIGFIFNADVILNENKHITYLNNNNASIHLIGENETKLYDEDKETVIHTLYNGDRIFVEKFDKNSEYTKVIFKTSDLKTIEGYIRTSTIKMDIIDNSTIIIICIIIVSILLLIIIIISYFATKKRLSSKK